MSLRCRVDSGGAVPGNTWGVLNEEWSFWSHQKPTLPEFSCHPALTSISRYWSQSVSHRLHFLLMSLRLTVSHLTRYWQLTSSPGLEAFSTALSSARFRPHWVHSCFLHSPEKHLEGVMCPGVPGRVVCRALLAVILGWGAVVWGASVDIYSIVFWRLESQKQNAGRFRSWGGFCS